MILLYKLIQILDRRPFRIILSFLATLYARKRTHRDVEMFYDNAWIFRSGSDCLVFSDHFAPISKTIPRWRKGFSAVLENRYDLWFFKYKPKPGDIIVDIGAGIGFDTLAFSKAIGKEGKVVSIEAYASTFQLLKKQCEHNNLNNVTLFQYAIIDKKQDVFIEEHEDLHDNTVSISPDSELRKNKVPGISLDELCDAYNIKHIDFLKMNIEGAELLAVKGMRRIISNINTICIACHDVKPDGNIESSTKPAIVEFLRENSFNIFTRDNEPRNYVRDQVHGVRRIE